MEALYFTATWCAPCKVFGPVMENISKDIPVNKIDIEQDMATTFDYGVMSVPTVILLKDDKEVARFLGAQTEDWVRDFISEVNYVEKPSGSIN